MDDPRDMGDLTGGTLVEYKMGCGLSREYARATIVETIIDDTGLEFKTDGKARLFTAEFSSSMIGSEDGVFYLLPISLGFYYALAPKGVTIPTPEERGLTFNPFRKAS